MSLQTGERLGPYEVVARLGEGGMGEVYRARDTRLGRDVAIKILPGGAAIDADRLARFEHEARAAAALNHPNITVLYDIGNHAPSAVTDGSETSPYLVIELLEGATLRDRLAGGPFPVRRAVDYARQVALGLAAAHEKGIVHRDLKPENIFITTDDRAKILDFGLAKLTESEPVAAGTTTLPTTPRVTMPGMVLGTAGYMAPEQVRGLAADHRADLFAFGAVLYEMLTGERAFRGETPMDVMMAVAREDTPSLATRRPDLPASLARIVERCLEKDPAARFQSTRDLAFALESQTSSAASSGAVAAPAGLLNGSRSATAYRWTWLLGGLAIGGLLAGLAAAFRPTSVSTVPRPLTLTLPSTFETFRLPGVASARPWYWSPSPDSRWLLGVDLMPDGRTKFVLHELATGSDRALDATAGSVNVINSAWSPDATMVAYWDATDGFLKKLAIDTGAVTRLSQFRDVRAIGWGPDGIVFANVPGGATRPGLYLVPPNGGEERSVGSDLRLPVVVPGGHVLADGVGNQSGMTLVNLRTGDRRIVAPGRPPLGYAGGYVLYNLQERLVAQRLDLAGATLAGQPIAIGAAASQRVFASDTVLSWVTLGANESASLSWVDRSGRRLPLTGEIAWHSGTTLAMHGDQQIAIGRVGPDATADLWTIRLDTGATSRVSAEPSWEDHGRWSRDGRRLLFRSNDMLKIAEVGSALPPRTTVESLPLLERLDDWSPDERHALVSVVTAERRYDIVSVDLQARGTPVPIATTPATESFARFSPDGTMVAYVSDTSGPPEVYVQPFPAAAASQRVSRSGGTVPKWSQDGSRVYFLSPDAWIMEARIARERGETRVGAPVRVVPASGQDFMPTSDAQRFLLLESARPRSLALVNWRSLLRD